jgi:hypothetical protein
VLNAAINLAIRLGDESERMVEILLLASGCPVDVIKQGLSKLGRESHPLMTTTSKDVIREHERFTRFKVGRKAKRSRVYRDIRQELSEWSLERVVVIKE